MSNKSNSNTAAKAAATATAAAVPEAAAPSATEAAETKAVTASPPAGGYTTRETKAEQARIVAEIEAMSAIPCTPTQEELNQAMANATQAAIVSDEEA